MFCWLRMRSVLAALMFCASGIWFQPTWAESDAEPVDAATIEKNRKANAECFKCHSEAGLKKPPRADLDLVKLREFLLDTEAFSAANHGHMDCRQCHGQGYNDYPHSPTGKDETSPCSECHANKVARLEPQFDASVHVRDAAVKDKFTCSVCHDPHLMQVAKKLGAPRLIARQDNAWCASCHDSDTVFAKYAPDDEKRPGQKKPRPDIAKSHAWLPNQRQHMGGVRCVDCHTPAVAANKMQSHEILVKDKAEKKCLACHAQDSALRTRLYRHLVKDEVAKFGFTNGAVLDTAYVIGATRHALLDRVIIGVVLLTLLGVLVHGGVRAVCALMRRKRSK